MKNKFLINVLAVFFVLITNLSYADDFNDTVDVIQFKLDIGDAKGAYKLAEEFVKNNPQSYQANILFARAANATKKFNRAANSARTAYNLNPSNAARYELAVAYAGIGQDDLAKKQLNFIKENSPYSLPGSVDAVMEALKSEAKYQSADIYAAFGLIYDSNLTQGTNSTVFVNAHPIPVDPDNRSQSSFATQAAFSVHTDYRLKSLPSVVLLANLDTLVVDYSGLKHDYLFLKGSAGAFYSIKKMDFGFELNKENKYTFSKERQDNYGADIYTDRYLNEKLSLRVGGSYTNRTFTNNRGRSGPLTGVYAELQTVIDENKKATFGTGTYRTFARDSIYSNNSYDFYANTDIKINPKTNVVVGGFYSKIYYDAPGSAFELSKKMNDHVQLKTDAKYSITVNTEVAFSYKFIKNFSNSPFDRYDRHQVGLSINHRL